MSNQTQNASTPEVENPLVSLDEQFKLICEELSTLTGTIKTVQLKVKDLQKNCKSACKPKKVKKHTVMHDPMNISSELLKYLGKASGSKMTKSEAMKSVSERVKTDGLQNQENKRQFTPNKSLAKILNMKTAKTITFVELNKHLSHHFTAC
tara:strand:- start:266 stop:718 length:453 start_codon:yes stop_codon:yes gene_type:complete